MVQQAATAKIKAEEIKEEEEALEEMVVVGEVGEVGEVEVDEAVEEAGVEAAGVEAPLVEVVEHRQLVLPILPQQSLNQLRFSVCVRILLC